MNEARRRRRAAFSLAVLRGLDRGKVLRTGRSRVVVGSHASSDLVLRDPAVAPRHLRIVVEDGTWRADAAGEADVVIDRGWTHPVSGERGALIHLGGAELLLFVGDLDDDTIQAELKKRSSPSSRIDDANAITAVEGRPDGLDAALRAPAGRVDSDLPTIGMPAISAAQLDPVAIANMPTQARAEVPADLLENRRVTPEPQQVTNIIREGQGPKAGSAWDRGRRERPGAASPVPEVLAEPESQMVRMPGAELSAMRPSPLSEDDLAAPTEAWSSANAASAPPAGGRPRKNAWGDSGEPARAMVASESPRREGGNAWGDHRSPRSQPPAPSGGPISRGPVPGLGDERPGLELDLRDILRRSQDPGLTVVRAPDGSYATAVRLLGTRLQELFRSFGYRTFMMTSVEPLTGKTTAAVNLALALSEDPNRRVALLEANFRFPRIGEILGLPEDFGLLPVLEGRRSVQESTLKIRDRNLVVFPAGGRHPHPASLLSAPRFKTLVNDLATTVDVAILDSPSVRPSADTNLVLGLVDGALLVALEGHTTSRGVDIAGDRLGRERILGALYNALPKSESRALNAERRARLRAST